MKAYLAGALTVAAAWLLVTLFVHGPRAAALKVENQAAREWAANETTRRLASQRALDSVRAASRDAITRLTQRAARTGVAAARLVDSVFVIAPPDCQPYLRLIRDSMLVHLAADDSLRRANEDARRADSLAIADARARVADAERRLHESLNRTDTALDTKAGHGWVVDAALVVATYTVVTLVRR